MSQKIYYDSVNNKEVVDVSGVKTGVIAEFGLDVSTQEITVDIEAGEVHYVDAGILKKKTKIEVDAEADAKKVIKDAEKKSKEDSAQAILGLNDTDWAVVKDALL